MGFLKFSLAILFQPQINLMPVPSMDSLCPSVPLRLEPHPEPVFIRYLPHSCAEINMVPLQRSGFCVCKIAAFTFPLQNGITMTAFSCSLHLFPLLPHILRSPCRPDGQPSYTAPNRFLQNSPRSAQSHQIPSAVSEKPSFWFP